MLTIHKPAATRSSRLSRMLGQSPISAKQGLAAALERQQGKAAAPQASGTASPAPPAIAAKPKTRIQIVAEAVEKDERCKGKAAAALALLASDELASVSGSGLVKLLQKTPASASETFLKEVNGTNARAQRMQKASASASVWDRAIEALNSGKDI